MRVAADGFAAISVVGQELCFVPNTDLAHLDPGLKGSREIFDEVSKVDAFFRQVVEDHPFSSEDDLDVNEVHLQSSLRDELPAGSEPDVAKFGEALLGRQVFRRGCTNDLASDWVFEKASRAFGCWAKDFT